MRTLAIANDGDQPLLPPTFEVTGSSPAQVAAFSVESLCIAPLALGETCDLNLTFAPTEATAHAATLNISPMGATTSVLLIGEAQVPGNLVLTATDSGGAFGDVPIGTSTSRAIVLTNPGQIPRGASPSATTIASRQTSATATKATRRGWSTARAAPSTCASPQTTTCPKPPI